MSFAYFYRILFFSLNLKIFFINVKNNLSWFIFDLLIVNFYHAKVLILFLFLLLFLVKFINIFFYHIGFLVTENFSLYLGYRKIQPYYIFIYLCFSFTFKGLIDLRFIPVYVEMNDPHFIFLFPILSNCLNYNCLLKSLFGPSVLRDYLYHTH